MERLTQDLVREASAKIEEIENGGGMAKAVAEGWPKWQIEEAAARRQARIDSGQEVIVGVNKYQATAPGDARDKGQLEVLSIDPDKVRKIQVERIGKLKRERDDKRVRACIEVLEKAAKDVASGSEHVNLLAASIEAARARCTLGEISSALERIWTRYEPPIRVSSGIYVRSYQRDSKDPEIESLTRAIREFADKRGRPPRILIAKMGQDGHDRGMKVMASGLVDIGMDVDLGPLFATPEEVAQQALDADVHIVGVSTLAGGHKTLVPALRRVLDEKGGKAIKIVVGGVIPEQDYAALRTSGADMIFGPGTRLVQAAKDMVSMLAKQQ